jgi:hypothetical protein
VCCKAQLPTHLQPAGVCCAFVAASSAHQFISMGTQGTATGTLSATRAQLGPFGGTLRNEHAPPDSTIESLIILRPVFTIDDVVLAFDACRFDDEQEVRPSLCVCPRYSGRCDDARIAGMIAAERIRTGDTSPSSRRTRRYRRSVPVRSSRAYLRQRSGSLFLPAALSRWTVTRA